MRFLRPGIMRVRHGAETLEFLVAAVVMLVITMGAVLITNAFGNAMAAQHALTQTALYVSANGRYTQEIRDRCEQMLPGEGEGTTSCLVRQADTGQLVPPAANASAAPPVPFGRVLTISVRYRQPWFQLCIPGFTSETTCPLFSDRTIERSINVPSQTQELRTR